MERRLQTMVFRKGLARSIKQSRQFITHRHIAINNSIITAPSYIVSIAEEPLINFVARSSLISADHPERVRKEEKKGQIIKKDRQQSSKEEGKRPAEVKE